MLSGQKWTREQWLWWGASTAAFGVGAIAAAMMWLQVAAATVLQITMIDASAGGVLGSAALALAMLALGLVAERRWQRPDAGAEPF